MRKFKINGNVTGVIQGRPLKDPVVEFAGASVNPDMTETVFIKYTDDCGCEIVRPYDEDETRNDYDDYILNHPLHSGIVELPTQQANAKKK